jgi:glycosyltransferase involved in cell wall biosynthesis
MQTPSTSGAIFPSCAVIITTYNSPELLEKVLWGYEHQSWKDFTLVIADDGSGPATKRLIDSFRQRGKLNLRHVWQEDNGFQKTKILNKAVVATDSQYMIFSDGDCIPTPTFVEGHLRLSRPDRFVSATLFRLTALASWEIDEESVASGEVFQAGWLSRHGQPLNWRLIRWGLGPKLGGFFNRTSLTRLYWCGGNASAWRKDILAVNGFNEDMAYGGLDKEFGERLINLGVRPISARHTVTVLHQDHGRDYADPAKRARNRQIITEVRSTGMTWTENGIQQARRKSA